MKNECELIAVLDSEAKQETSRVLWHFMKSLTEGKALKIVKSVTSRCGLEAFRIVYKRLIQNDEVGEASKHQAILAFDFGSRAQDMEDSMMTFEGLTLARDHLEYYFSRNCRKFTWFR